MNDVLHTPVIIGHDEALRQVAEAFSSERMHHAWMITGIEGVGKATLAYHIAHHALSGGQNKAGKIDMGHRAAKLITAEAHPDMLVIRRTADDKTGELRNVILVEDTLKIASFLHKTSTHGGWRVVIIDEAHRLNRFGMNAILKILEEPPPRTLILITVTTPGLLLPTIRSRCRILPLMPLSKEQMSCILAQKKPDLKAEDIKHLVELSGGSIGFALKIMQTETLPLYDEMFEIIGGMPKLDVARLHKLAEQISRKTDIDSFDVLTSLLENYLRQRVKDQALTDSKIGHLDRKIQLWDKVRATFSMANTGNLDRKLAFVNALTDIRAIL